MIDTISTPISRRTRDSDHVDDIGVGAKFSEVKNPLLRNDSSDQKGNQCHYRNCLPADAIEMKYGGGAPQRARPQHYVCDRRANGAEHGQKKFKVDVTTNRCVSDTFKRGGQPVCLVLQRRRAKIYIVNFFKKVAKPFRYSSEGRPQFLQLITTHEPFKQPGAKCVQVVNARNVDNKFLRRASIDGEASNKPFEVSRLRGSPGTANNQGCRSCARSKRWKAHPFPLLKSRGRNCGAKISR